MTPTPDQWLRDVGTEPFAYLTTTGRVTGRPHEIEIWFVAVGPTVYFLAGDRDGADWVRNLQRDPRVTVRIAGRTARGTARVVPGGTPEDATARDLLWRRYTGPGDDLTSWRDRALAVAVDISAGATVQWA